jgi:hypothetical protein
MPRAPAPSSCKKRNPLPIPYSLSPSPLSTPPLSQHDSMPARSGSSSKLPDQAEQDRQVWGSFETLLRAQKDILEAQTARLAECTATITTQIDSLKASHDRSARRGREESSLISQALEEFKVMVRRIKEDGYRFPRYVDFEKVLSMGWMSGEVRLPVIEPVRSDIGCPEQGGRGGARGSTGSTGSTGDTRVDTPQLTLDELIDMSQFEELHDGTIPEASGSGRGWSSGGESVQASVPPPIESDARQKIGGNTGISFQSITPALELPDRDPHPAPSTHAIPSSPVKKMQPPPFRHTVQHEASGSTSTSAAPRRPKHSRRDSVRSLSSGVESLPQSRRHSRAGSNMTDILAGIDSYLVRPNRQRPVPDSESPEPIPAPPQPEGRLRRRTNRPIYSTKWHPMDGPRKRLRLEEEERAAAEAADEEVDSIRGLSTAPVIILPKSDGVEKVNGRKWSKWGENTLIGRMVSWPWLMSLRADFLANNQL